MQWKDKGRPFGCFGPGAWRMAACLLLLFAARRRMGDMGDCDGRPQRHHILLATVAATGGSKGCASRDSLLVTEGWATRSPYIRGAGARTGTPTGACRVSGAEWEGFALPFFLCNPPRVHGNGHLLRVDAQMCPFLLHAIHPPHVARETTRVPTAAMQFANMS